MEFISNILEDTTLSDDNKMLVIDEYLDINLQQTKDAIFNFSSSDTKLKVDHLWVFITNYLLNNKSSGATRICISLLEKCLGLSSELEFLQNKEDTAVKSILAIVQVFYYNKTELMKPSLKFLDKVSSLDIFWKKFLFKLVVQHASDDLKCTIVIWILKQKLGDENIDDVFKTIFNVVNEHECIHEKCPIFSELKCFCENTSLNQFTNILNEVLNISWHADPACDVLEGVLVQSKKNQINFDYFHRFVEHFSVLRDEFQENFWPYKAGEALTKLFWDQDNFKILYEIIKTRIHFDSFCLTYSKEVESVAFKKMLELNSTQSDDMKEIEIYFYFIPEIHKLLDLIKNNLLSPHIKIMIYKRLFTMSWYYTAEQELDHEKTIADFYEYLMNYLNEKTYRTYLDLMLYFLDIMDRFMGFAYPEKVCSEIIEIMRCPELYSKYQLYCALELLRRVDFRFKALYYNGDKYYKEIGTKWQSVILESDDEIICREGLYFVLKKGQLNEEEYTSVVKQILEKHICDSVAQELFGQFLRPELMGIALKHLDRIKEKNLEKYNLISELFCEKVCSSEYLASNFASLQDDCVKVCFLNSRNLYQSVYTIYYDLAMFSEDIRHKTLAVDLSLEIYLNKLCDVRTKVYCLQVFMRLAERFRQNRKRPSRFVKSFKDDLKMLIHKLRDKYGRYLGDDIIKLRIVQALILLVPHVTCEPKNATKKGKNNTTDQNISCKQLQKLLKKITIGILVKEAQNENGVIRHICQYMYVLLSQYDLCFREVKSILDKIEEEPHLADSFLPVVYHVMPFCKFSEKEITKVLQIIFSLSATSNSKLGTYIQVLRQWIYDQKNNKLFKNLHDQQQSFESKFKQNKFDIEIDEKVVKSILGINYLLLKDSDPIKDYSVETILQILPKLNEVDINEWKYIMDYATCFYPIRIFYTQRDENEGFKKNVNTFLATKDIVEYNVNEILDMLKNQHCKR